jgi:hypothetical protein
MMKTVSLLASMALAVLVLLAAQSEASAAKEAQYGPRLAVSNYYSHTTADDPMFHFGEPGVGHLHDFFCNASTDAFSTYDSLVLEPDDTCKQEGDKSAYWAPVHADLNNGVYERLEPVGKMIGYYEVTPGLPQRNIKPFAPGFRLVSRDGSAGPGRVLYRCSGGTFRSSPPDRCGNEILVVRYISPPCWDGKTDAPAAYDVVKAGATACPRTHPVNVPRVFMTVGYRMPDPALTLRVSAGEGAWERYGFDHFNMLNAWDQPTQEYKTRDCLISTKPGERRPEHCRTSIVGES